MALTDGRSRGLCLRQESMRLRRSRLYRGGMGGYEPLKGSKGLISIYTVLCMGEEIVVRKLIMCSNERKLHVNTVL